MWLALVAVAVVLGIWWLTRSSELFVVSVRKGRVLVLRGRMPATLLTAIREVVERPPVRRATIRAMRTETAARLDFSGDLDEGRQQRLRNVFGLYPMSRLRAAPAVKRPTVGQLLGIAWLAWWLEGWMRR